MQLKQSLTRWLERRWYGDTAPGGVLRWLAARYGGMIAQRRREYLYSVPRMMRVGVPVVAIGNLTIGGAGKTPLTMAVVEGLHARGLRVGVVSRGYGRRDPALRRVSATDAAADVGDEPLLIARRTGAPVVVSPGRYLAARTLEDAGTVDVIVADDALQHYSLLRDIEILVIDGRRGLGNARLLPAGPLREPVERGLACDFVVVNAGTGQGIASDAAVVVTDDAPSDVQADIAALQARCITMHLHATDAVHLRSDARRPLAGFSGQRVHAVAAIADPERFFDTLRQHGIEPVPHPFPDHHAFLAGDLAFGDTLPVVMTEKDAVKCTAFVDDRMHSVPIDAVVPGSFLDALAERIRTADVESRR